MWTDGRTSDLTKGRTNRQTDRLTEMTKLIVAFCKFPNASNICLNRMKKTDTIRRQGVSLQYQPKGRCDIGRPRQKGQNKNNINFKGTVSRNKVIDILHSSSSSPLPSSSSFSSSSSFPSSFSNHSTLCSSYLLRMSLNKP
jgi:hypothetical protein